jgi:hypothetical protein
MPFSSAKKIRSPSYNQPMGRSVVISTPIPTADELAKRLRIGKKRLAMIREIVHTNSSASAHRRTSTINRQKV